MKSNKSLTASALSAFSAHSARLSILKSFLKVCFNFDHNNLVHKISLTWRHFKTSKWGLDPDIFAEMFSLSEVQDSVRGYFLQENSQKLETMICCSDLLLLLLDSAMYIHITYFIMDTKRDVVIP